MSRSRPHSLLLIAGGLLLILLTLFFLTHRPASAPAPSVATPPADETPPLRRTLSAPSSADPDTGNLAQAAATVADLSLKLSTRLNHASVRPGEAVLLFKTAEGYQRFLARAAVTGVTVDGRIDALNLVRVRIRAYDTFAAELVARAADYGGVSANAFVEMPPAPPERPAALQLPVGNTLLATLGVAPGTDTSAWGRGVTIAILDGGALPDPTFGARLRYQDIGLGYAGTGAAGLHGTAVASLAAGSSPDAPGVAPAATLLSIRVINTDGKSDLFTVVQGIVAAVDAGAQIINLSLGGYSSSAALDRAVTYASERGSVIVAAAGNDGATRLVWPAAEPRVVSVGATDAAGRQAAFSNSGLQLALTAPGVGLQAAGLANERVLFSGTSASAPVVSGALATLLSQSPGLTPAQAAEILKTHADDAGPAGADPDYGGGVLNLGWVLTRDNPARHDTAVSSHHYNPATGSLDVVIQNRGSSPAARLVLVATVDNQTTHHPLPELPAGHSATFPVPVPPGSVLTIRTLLENPPGVTDAVPANNTRASRLDLSGR